MKHEESDTSPDLREHVSWPLSWIERETFSGYVHARLTNGASANQLHLDDLYLACACVHARPEALQAFEGEILRKLRSVIARYTDGSAAIDEAYQELREKLLVARQGEPARIQDFSGAGRLYIWVRTTVVRMLVDQKRKKGTLHTVSDEEIYVRAVEPGSDPELACMHQQIQLHMKDAISHAISQLNNEQHNLLRLHFVEGLNFARIALLLGVHRSTVLRDIRELKASIRQATAQFIQQQFKTRPTEIESLLRAVDSQLEISLLRLLQAPGSG